ncbi:hypothetical protein [Fibrobacter sp. UWEL]|uniref:hypothetical protein n=1 Tax=Fibrobacter sp. UWEL TaxID=1896209 RepID=UPI000915105B|nr:hypothetical protein [Fibrobacter sp. UWEL]SHL16995.1 hypothetical protein SAMN05720468_11570 [Fibrobacter sp. UWEL]
MIKPAHIIIAAFLAVSVQAGIFSSWQTIYVSADDNQAYDFYANGQFLCSGKKCHYKNMESSCKIEFVAKKGERIYGIEEFGDDYQWEKRSFLAKVLLDNRDENSPCTGTHATVKIDPTFYIQNFLPEIITHTNWRHPIPKNLQVPKPMPSRADWKKSPFEE